MKTEVHTTNGFWWTLAALVAVWLLWMTLRPNPAVAANLAPLTRSAAARGISLRLLIGLAGNVIVFMPLGLAVAMALRGQPLLRRFLWATAAGAALSLCIELLQSLLPSRVAAWDDWLLNSAGAGLGALVACVVVVGSRE